MKAVVFIISLIVLLCVLVMLCAAITRNSHHYYMGVISAALEFFLSCLLVRVTYLDLKE